RDYIIATNTYYTNRDLCQVAFARLGLDWREHVESDPRLMRPTEIAAARGDYSKAKAELGWQPRTQFRELIEMMVDEDMRRLS
nr:GDP-mannose 4,6-dehydratase [Anaerolineae bacterium]